MKEFENKVVLITGSAEGIGKTIAEVFAENGANLVLTDISSNIESAAAKISQDFGVKTLGIIQNVSSEEDCKKAIDETIKKFGQIDVLINNAGITRDGLSIKMKEKDFDDVISVNLKGPFLMCKHAFIHMSSKRYGKIINISSVVGQTGQAGQANYSASKAGLIGLTKSLAREFSKRNINVNAIAPGFITTKMTEKLEEKVKESIISQIPLNRFGSPADVANVALFLASDKSSYITGQVISVNGGLYM
ncbi:MAG: 3-oxoacyl-[acyl-carrier-protein] reductase [Elusimicrobiales bacterium]|nr:3-oxoacyl-[acyl-carrier-protein] reductase [Elusimicrobiales bacterium]HOL62894.1 3-oxoacyl-[acyl-carrier-protein] reductase [Elusimicrobiales bacterium]HPO95952.1 3-oxoacyl-[acyl-carrier-protein] reductase [Elusimicrobiales bacterium]